MELVQGHEIDEFSESKYFRKIKKLRKTNRFEVCWIISKLRRPEILCTWDTRIEYYFICMPAARRDGVRSITRTLQCASLWELRVIRLTCSAAASTAERSCGALAWHVKESMFMPAEGRKSKCRDPDLSKPHKYSTVAILKGFCVWVHVCSFDATAYVIKTKLVYF